MSSSCVQASDLGFFFLRPKEAISVRLREQAAVVAAQPSGEHEDQYASFDGDGGALCWRCCSMPSTKRHLFFTKWTSRLSQVCLRVLPPCLPSVLTRNAAL